MSTPAAGAVSRLEALVGSSAFTAEPERLAEYGVDGIIPIVALQPSSAEEVVEIVKFAAAEKLAIVSCGARTKIGIGLPPRQYDVALDLTRLNKIVAYDPGDLTLSVEPGVLLCKLQQHLNQHGQFLPHSAPFMTRATIGGTVASGVEGPLRQMYGTARDFVLGMEFVTGDGVAGKSGGRVVKNVTGYDLHKLLIGSLGTLAVITKINLRTFPAPQSLRAFALHFATAGTVTACRDAVAASALRPMTTEIMSRTMAELFACAPAFRREPHTLPEGVLSAIGWTLSISFNGNEAVLDRCENEMRRVAESAGAERFVRVGNANGKAEPISIGSLYVRLREFIPIALASSPGCTILKISVLPAQLQHALSAAEHAANDQSLAWAAVARGVGVTYIALLPGGRDEKALNCVSAAANRIREDCARIGGHSTIPWCPSEWKSALNIWGPDRPELALMRKVRNAFDPRGILAPGRFMGGI